MTVAGRSILLVEDSPTYRELATLLLAEAGWGVVHAGTAEEGLRLARAQPPILILMDTNLPGMNGFDAVRELRRDPCTRHIPVVGMTASRVTGSEELETARLAGFDAYVEKPTDEATFRSLLGPYIGTAS